ncbi:response regulator transcription factor [Microbacterium album]|uniref:Sensory transduction protein n=1 Tax=Microbacterium album TaxID=2053191 RepID=A0A917MPQ5_9MICO|nr:response regulator transcription factor [Microbacterium album]GGH48649.1 putative sensory transduction protein [Microbacterium album]
MEHPRVAVVVEDDEDIRVLINEVLVQAGFEVHSASTGLEGVRLVQEHQPLVTTLDLSMPGIDGFETAKRIRAISVTYLVMLTARADEIDVLQGLQAGADDYLTKPFRPRELRARVEAMMRRPRVPTAVVAPAPDSASPPAEVGWLEHRGVRLHPDMRVVTVEGEALELTRTEFDLLEKLLRAGVRVVSKHQLSLALRDESRGQFVSDHDLRAIEVHMANLRRKLGESATRPRWIETVRGVGYRLTAR